MLVGTSGACVVVIVDKQRIAELFQVEVGLDDLPYEEGDDLSPQSLQPVIFTKR
jgi:hypothetical protein